MSQEKDDAMHEGCKCKVMQNSDSKILHAKELFLQITYSFFLFIN
jgi:hypothetical protein